MVRESEERQRLQMSSCGLPNPVNEFMIYISCERLRLGGFAGRKEEFWGVYLEVHDVGRDGRGRWVYVCLWRNVRLRGRLIRVVVFRNQYNRSCIFWVQFRDP